LKASSITSVILAGAGLRLRLEHHRSRAVAEQHAGAAVVPIEDARKGLRADHQRALECAGLEQGVDGRKTEHEARAHRLQIEGRAVVDAEPSLNRDRARGKGVVGGGGREHNQIDRLRIHVSRRKRGARGCYCHVGRGFALGRDVPLANAGALRDPLVGGIHHPRQLGIAEDPARQIAAAAEHHGPQQRHEPAPPTARADEPGSG
jgi:hypothetical protein